MNITLKTKRGKKIYLNVQSQNYIIHEGKSLTKNSEQFKNASYYTSLETALWGLLQKALINSQAKTLKELSEEIKFLKNQLLEILELSGGKI